MLNNRPRKKGQAALDYLMTYGWGILIIIIVGIVLWQMGIFNLGTTTPTRCEFSGGIKAISCILNNGSITLIVSSTVSQNINLTEAWADGCTTPTIIGNILGTGESQQINITGCTNAITGRSFDTRVYINYTSVMTPMQHTASGYVSGIVE